MENYEKFSMNTFLKRFHIYVAGTSKRIGMQNCAEFLTLSATANIKIVVSDSAMYDTTEVS